MPITISVATGQDWLQRRRSNQDRYNDNHLITGFTVSIQDLIDLEDEHYVSDARAYISVTPAGEEKIILVPAYAKGNDMIDVSLGQYVYNITPCQPTCGSGGLNNW